MATQNSNVGAGIANGTCATFERAVFKPGATATPVQLYGKWVYAIDIADVDHLVLRWTDSKFRGCFKLHPKDSMFDVRFPVWDTTGRMQREVQRIHLHYIPMLINYATTGHKLQGKSLDTLVIGQWTAMENWAYVVLSRVRTLDGLFLLEPIPRNIRFEPSQQYHDMMQDLRVYLADPEHVRHLYNAV